MNDDISPLAVISPGAKLGRGVRVGPFSVIEDNVIIGDNTHVESHCVLGHPASTMTGATSLRIGENSLIRSHSVFYTGSSFGPGLRTGHRVTVREGITAGKDLQIGTLCDFQGHATIGDFVRTHSNVHIGQKTVVGNFVWIFPYVVLTNDPHPPSDGFLVGAIIEDYAVIATMACVMPGVTIGTRSLVAAHALVSKNVAPNMVVGGVPAKELCPTSEVLLRDGSGKPAYPWTTHFRRGYPPEVVEQWDRDTRAEHERQGVHTPKPR